MRTARARPGVTRGPEKTGGTYDRRKPGSAAWWCQASRATSAASPGLAAQPTEGPKRTSTARSVIDR